MDPVSAARSARESLARGLAALQSPGLPPQLLTVADPVAQAMSALHRIESSAGAALVEAAPAALAFVRQALALLQSQGLAHPAVEQGMEAIASSLGIVHQLAQEAAQAASRPAAPVPVSPYAGTMMAEAQPPVPASATQRSQNIAYGARPEPQPQVAFVNPQPAPPPQQRQPAPAAPPPAVPPAAQQWQKPAAPAAAAPPPQQWQPTAGAPAAAASSRVEAALGAHSATNFYKGLSGNDVIESGGIFVATYQIPPIGTELVIRVSLPGGYEFEALAVVRWTREAPQSGADSSPGFGAQFTQISPEGQKLVHRYVRNREPLFHDDF